MEVHSAILSLRMPFKNVQKKGLLTTILLSILFFVSLVLEIKLMFGHFLRANTRMLGVFTKEKLIFRVAMKFMKTLLELSGDFQKYNLDIF